MASLRALSSKAGGEAKALKLMQRIDNAVSGICSAMKSRARRCSGNTAMAIAILRRLQPHRAADFALWSDVGCLLYRATAPLPDAERVIAEALPYAKREAAFLKSPLPLQLMERSLKVVSITREDSGEQQDEDNDWFERKDQHVCDALDSFGFDKPLREYKNWSKRSSKWEELRHLGYQDCEFDSMCDRRWDEYKSASSSQISSKGVDQDSNIPILDFCDESEGGSKEENHKSESGKVEGDDERAAYWEGVHRQLTTLSKTEAKTQRTAILALTEMMVEDNRYAPVTAEQLASTCGG